MQSVWGVCAAECVGLRCCCCCSSCWRTVCAAAPCCEPPAPLAAPPVLPQLAAGAERGTCKTTSMPAPPATHRCWCVSSALPSIAPALVHSWALPRSLCKRWASCNTRTPGVHICTPRGCPHATPAFFLWVAFRGLKPEHRPPFGVRNSARWALHIVGCVAICNKLVGIEPANPGCLPGPAQPSTHWPCASLIDARWPLRVINCYLLLSSALASACTAPADRPCAVSRGCACVVPLA